MKETKAQSTGDIYQEQKGLKERIQHTSRQKRTYKISTSWTRASRTQAKQEEENTKQVEKTFNKEPQIR